jgi:hypothetical protein
MGRNAENILDISALEHEERNFTAAKAFTSSSSSSSITS